MKKLLLFSIVLITLFSCKKAKIEEVNTNNSKDSLTYQPKVPGSKWSYKMTIALVNNSNYNTIRENYDSVINGKTYAVFNSEVEGKQFIRQDGDKYYSVLTSSTNKVELLMLDASRAVNDTWVGGVNGSDTYYYTILEKFPVYVLDGFTFKNVLRIKLERKDGSNITTMTAEAYYAQGIGQIRSEGTVASVPVSVKLITVDLK